MSFIHIFLANSLRSKGLEVYEEVHCLADGDSNRRIDIIAINRQKASADIVDPTIRFEVSLNQPNEVDLEKKKNYEPSIPYFLEKYNLKKISVTGLFFGSRGTISKFFVTWRNKYKIEKSVQEEIIFTVIKYSVAILRNHLYGLNSC